VLKKSTMAKKVNSYISVELDWAEAQLKTWREYIDANPMHLLEDRWGKKEMPRGGHTWVVTATREQQIKSVQETMVKYLQLLEVVDKLREKEEAKQEAKGDAAIPHRMKNGD
jgi:predicted RNA polymerase sigma factor